MRRYENWWDHTPANYVTLLRVLIGLLGLTVYMWERAYLWHGFGIFTLACALDALDGHIAREWQCESWSGRLMDPLADKTLEWSSYAVLIDYVRQHESVTVQMVPVFIALIVTYGIGTMIARTFDSRMRTSKIAKQKQILLFCAINSLLFAVASAYSGYAQISSVLFLIGWVLLAASTVACALSALTYFDEWRRRTA